MSGVPYNNSWDPAVISMDDPTQPLDVVLAQAFDSHMRETVHTMLPCVVTTVRNSSVVDVQPLLKRRYKSGVVQDLPVIQQVPLLGLFGQTWWIKCPVAVGDTGVLVVSERSWDAWLLGSSPTQTVDPLDARTFDLTDGGFLPGLRSFRNALPAGPNASDMVLHNGSAEVHIQSAGTFALTNGTNELFNLVNQTLTALINALVATDIGPQPFIPATVQTLQQIQTKFKTLIGT